MKTIICACFALCLFSSFAFAESSKLTKVDLDVKTTHLVKAELGRDDLVYYIDLTACVCWVSQSMGSSFSVSTFDCSKLTAHPKLEKLMAECGPVKKEEVKETVPTAAAVEEPKKEEVKPVDTTTPISNDNSKGTKKNIKKPKN